MRSTASMPPRDSFRADRKVSTNEDARSISGLSFLPSNSPSLLPCSLSPTSIVMGSFSTKAESLDFRFISFLLNSSPYGTFTNHHIHT